jgi:hypothetical protein
MNDDRGARNVVGRFGLPPPQALALGTVARVARKVAAPRPHYDRFLAGPVPWAWVEAAAKLPGKALHVGLALWRLRGITKAWTVKLNLSAIDLVPDRSTASRALSALERAGLVVVDRSDGRASVVTIVDAEAVVEAVNPPGNSARAGTLRRPP